MIHISLVAGLAFKERLSELPSEFQAELRVEPENTYNPRAIAVAIGPNLMRHQRPSATNSPSQKASTVHNAIAGQPKMVQKKVNCGA